MPIYSGLVPVAVPTPYITPDILTSAPTGISWNTIPDLRSDPEERAAALLDICLRATADAEGITNQPLRATLDSETCYGPSFRCSVNRHTGVGRVLLSRSPVTDIRSVQVSATASFPPGWTTLTADQVRPELPLMGVYGTTAPGSAGDSGGQAILLAPGNLTTAYGEDGTMIAVSYVNGWPHAALTATITDQQLSTSQIAVDSCTGWWNTTLSQGAVGVLDSGTFQEVITVTAASATDGPGTLTLASPLRFPHDAGVLVTTLPASVQEAVIYLATAQALVRGATATTVQSLAGGHAEGGGPSREDLVADAEVLLHPFRRIL